jgi:hypothetical protein
MTPAPATFESECWKSFFRNFLLLATLLLCPFPLRASDEAKVAELKKWYAEVTAQMRAGEHVAQFGLLSRVLMTSPELSALFGDDESARMLQGRLVDAAGFAQPEGWSAQEWIGAEFRPHLAVAKLEAPTVCRPPMVWADRRGDWVPDLARFPGALE